MQAKEVKELTHVDHTKIYGERLTEPILGHYYRPSERTTQFHEIKFDTSFPYVIARITIVLDSSCHPILTDSCLSTPHHATIS
jgi:hypothetical protein